MEDAHCDLSVMKFVSMWKDYPPNSGYYGAYLPNNVTTSSEYLRKMPRKTVSAVPA